MKTKGKEVDTDEASYWTGQSVGVFQKGKL